MYKRVVIDKFRGFDHFELNDLSRVNLIVGRNNAGKTSALEALEMIALGGRPVSLLRSPGRRGEVPSEESESRLRPEYDIRHLFYQHTFQEGTYFKICAYTAESDFDVSCKVRRPLVEQVSLIPEPDDIGAPLEVVINGSENLEGTTIPVSPSGAMSGEMRRIASQAVTSTQVPVAFLGTEGSDPALLQRMWDKLVLTSEEEKVVSAMQIIEPTIERIAFTTRDGRWPAHAWVKLKDNEHRVPLGSLGDGIRRLLSLAIYIARSSGGILLVDEIDTGLHYSTLEKMWQFIVESSLRLDIQVFATSHSGDCLRALAWLETDLPKLGSEISVHRIDKETGSSERYTSSEIGLAFRHHIEVRG
jgi:hypothetical protein